MQISLTLLRTTFQLAQHNFFNSNNVKKISYFQIFQRRKKILDLKNQSNRLATFALSYTKCVVYILEVNWLGRLVFVEDTLPRTLLEEIFFLGVTIVINSVFN